MKPDCRKATRWPAPTRRARSRRWRTATKMSWLKRPSWRSGMTMKTTMASGLKNWRSRWATVWMSHWAKRTAGPRRLTTCRSTRTALKLNTPGLKMQLVCRKATRWPAPIRMARSRRWRTAMRMSWPKRQWRRSGQTMETTTVSGLLSWKSRWATVMKWRWTKQTAGLRPLTTCRSTKTVMKLNTPGLKTQPVCRKATRWPAAIRSVQSQRWRTATRTKRPKRPWRRSGTMPITRMASVRLNWRSRWATVQMSRWTQRTAGQQPLTTCRSIKTVLKLNTPGLKTKPVCRKATHWPALKRSARLRPWRTAATLKRPR